MSDHGLKRTDWGVVTKFVARHGDQPDLAPVLTPINLMAPRALTMQDKAVSQKDFYYLRVSAV